MAKVGVVVFDADGTLFDSFDIIVGAYAHVANYYGYAAPTAEMVRAQLSQAPPVYQILETFFPKAPIDEMMEINSSYYSAHASETKPFAGLHSALKALHVRDVRLAIITGGNEKIHDVLAYHGVADYFTSVVHCGRVGNSKPDPEGFYLALRECGAEHDQAIMIGDSPTDILTGKNGEAALTVGITHGHGSRDSLLNAGADYVVDSLSEAVALLDL